MAARSSHTSCDQGNIGLSSALHIIHEARLKETLANDILDRLANHLQLSLDDPGSTILKLDHFSFAARRMGREGRTPRNSTPTTPDPSRPVAHLQRDSRPTLPEASNLGVPGVVLGDHCRMSVMGIVYEPPEV